MIKRILGAMVLVAFVGSMIGCDTMEGFGKDMEMGGEKIQDKARENK
jgi:predicted small secreted protein